MRKKRTPSMKDLIKEDPSLMEAMEEAPEVKWLFEEEIAAAVTETVESVSNATGEIESLGDADFDDEPSPELEDEIIQDFEDQNVEGSAMPKRNWAPISALAVLVLIAASAGIILTVHKLNPYRYFHEGRLEYRTDTWAGETDMLTPAGQWRVTQMSRPPQTIPIPEDADSASGDITTFGESWDQSSNQVCVQVSSGDHVLESISAAVMWEADPLKVEPLYLYPPQYHGLVQPHETVSMCGKLETLQWPSNGKWTFVASNAIGWPHP